MSVFCFLIVIVKVFHTTLAESDWKHNVSFAGQGYQNQPMMCFHGMAAINRILNLIGGNEDSLKPTCKENLGRPIDCNDIPTGCPSGVYMIYPRDSSGFKTYCEMDMDGGHWTVFQRRENGYTDFYRGWDDYRNGFGDPTSEFWLGNVNINKITAQGKYEMRIDMTDFDGNSAFAKYHEFNIGNENTGFKLTANGYYGTSGDSLVHHNENKFSTKDRDNDNHGSNCAQMFKGAWWFNLCVTSDLNGEYYIKTPASAHHGVYWRSWKGSDYSLKASVMMLRRSG